MAAHGRAHIRGQSGGFQFTGLAQIGRALRILLRRRGRCAFRRHHDGRLRIDRAVTGPPIGCGQPRRGRRRRNRPRPIRDAAQRTVHATANRTRRETVQVLGHRLAIGQRLRRTESLRCLLHRFGRAFGDGVLAESRCHPARDSACPANALEQRVGQHLVAESFRRTIDRTARQHARQVDVLARILRLTVSGVVGIAKAACGRARRERTETADLPLQAAREELLSQARCFAFGDGFSRAGGDAFGRVFRDQCRRALSQFFLDRGLAEHARNRAGDVSQDRHLRTRRRAGRRRDERFDDTGEHLADGVLRPIQQIAGRAQYAIAAAPRAAEAVGGPGGRPHLLIERLRALRPVARRVVGTDQIGRERAQAVDRCLRARPVAFHAAHEIAVVAGRGRRRVGYRMTRAECRLHLRQVRARQARNFGKRERRVFVANRPLSLRRRGVVGRARTHLAPVVAVDDLRGKGRCLRLVRAVGDVHPVRDIRVPRARRERVVRIGRHYRSILMSVSRGVGSFVVVLVESGSGAAGSKVIASGAAAPGVGAGPGRA